MDNNEKLSWQKIHTALHDGSESVTVDGKELRVSLASNGCRQVVYEDMDLGKCRFMEQNKRKTSEYAKRARNGETLTWVMPYNTNKSWQLIETPVKKEVHS